MAFNQGNSLQEKTTKLKKILVPVSGNPADEDAINLACALARKNKSEINVVYIIEVKRSLPLDAIVQSELNKAEQILSHAEDIAAENDYEIKTDVLQAREAGVAIVDDAVEKDVDLIIMGMDYKKRFGHFNLGDAVPYVLEEAPCQVLLLRKAIGEKVKI